jgi:hypothetical protein
VQGYNAQAVCTQTQVIIAAELSTDSPDGRLLEPMILAARDELAAIGIDEAPDVVLADGGYWNVPQIEAVVAHGSQVIVNPDSSARSSRPADQRKLRDATSAFTASTHRCNASSPARPALRSTANDNT